MTIKPKPLTPREELILTKCILLGCRIEFDNYGHPERASYRKYWVCYQTGDSSSPGFNVTGYGYTAIGAAYDWLRRSRIEL